MLSFATPGVRYRWPATIGEKRKYDEKANG